MSFSDSVPLRCATAPLRLLRLWRRPRRRRPVEALRAAAPAVKANRSRTDGTYLRAGSRVVGAPQFVSELAEIPVQDPVPHRLREPGSESGRQVLVCTSTWLRSRPRS